jgi:hypothetical protein
MKMTAYLYEAWFNSLPVADLTLINIDLIWQPQTAKRLEAARFQGGEQGLPWAQTEAGLWPAGPIRSEDR